MLSAILGAILLLTAPGTAHADAWVPVTTVHLTEHTELRALDPSTVQAHLTIHLTGYGLQDRTQVTVHVLLPEDAELLSARWTPTNGAPTEVQPALTQTVTWPGTVDQLVRTLTVLHSGAAPYLDALDALFPNRQPIRWRQLTFLLPVEGHGRHGESLGTLELTAHLPTHRSPSGLRYLAWPIPVAINPTYEVRTDRVGVLFAAVYDPETNRWRWILPTLKGSSEVLATIEGVSLYLRVGEDGTTVMTSPTGPHPRLSLPYVPVLLVLGVPPFPAPLQRGERAVPPSQQSAGTESHPTPLIPIVPIRRRR
ncbi:MAG: hypothetical protein ABGY09_06800 [Euryarchaeota archaeon]